MPSRWSRTRRGRAWTVSVMAVTAAVILAVAYLANKPAAGGDGGLTSVVLSGAASGPAPEVGEPAPDFDARTLEGAKVGPKKLRGRPLWLTFGASWCQPCRAENPDILAAYEKYRGRGLQVLAIFIQDSHSEIEEYAERTGLSYLKVDDADGRIASGYRIVGIPSHFFVDSSGVLRGIRIGTLDPSGMEDALAEIGVDVDRPAE
jgi:cytochrome c biogenesis protein CcmG/thiol:disulfide interchange protein DsbE